MGWAPLTNQTIACHLWEWHAITLWLAGKPQIAIEGFGNLRWMVGFQNPTPIIVGIPKDAISVVADWRISNNNQMASNHFVSWVSSTQLQLLVDHLTIIWKMLKPKAFNIKTIAQLLNQQLPSLVDDGFVFYHRLWLAIIWVGFQNPNNKSWWFVIIFRQWFGIHHPNQKPRMFNITIFGLWISCGMDLDCQHNHWQFHQMPSD